MLEHLEEQEREKEQKKKPAREAEAGADEAPKKRHGGIHVPEFWPYEEARKLFHHAEVHDGNTVDLKWEPPQTEKLVEYLCGDKGFRYVGLLT